MTHQVKVRVVRSNDLSSISGTHTVKRENGLLQVVLCRLRVVDVLRVPTTNYF